MALTVFQDKQIEKEDFSERLIPKGDYENCSFINCSFSNNAIQGLTFSSCTFHSCDLSLVKTLKVSLRDVKFIECKLLGVHFENCQDFLFLVDFEACILNLSSFFKLRLKKIRFKNCSLQEVDFVAADLSMAVFDNCDLTGAVFENTNLEKADFRTSFHYALDPEKNRLKGARFSMDGLVGLLGKYQIEVD